MSHVRSQIRSAVQTALMGLATTGNQVFASRTYHLRDDDLPALLIKTESESVIEVTLSSDAMMTRELTLVVEGYAKANDALDETLDDIADEVESELNESTLDGLCRNCIIESTEIGFDDTLDQPVGRISLTFKIVYFTGASTPSVAL